MGRGHSRAAAALNQSGLLITRRQPCQLPPLSSKTTNTASPTKTRSAANRQSLTQHIPRKDAPTNHDTPKPTRRQPPHPARRRRPRTAAAAARPLASSGALRQRPGGRRTQRLGQTPALPKALPPRRPAHPNHRARVTRQAGRARTQPPHMGRQPAHPAPNPQQLRRPHLHRPAVLLRQAVQCDLGRQQRTALFQRHLGRRTGRLSHMAQRPPLRNEAHTQIHRLHLCPLRLACKPLHQGRDGQNLWIR